MKKKSLVGLLLLACLLYGCKNSDSDEISKIVSDLSKRAERTDVTLKINWWGRVGTFYFYNVKNIEEKP